MEGLLGAGQERKCSVFAAMKNPVVQASFHAKARERIEAFVAFIERTRAQLTDGSLVCTVPTQRETPTGGSSQREATDSNSAPADPPAFMGGCEAGKDRPLRAWARRFLAETGYLDELRRSEKDAETAENRVRNLQDLVASMDDGERQGLPPAERLQSFLEDLALDGDREEEKENNGDAVTLITMHSCKGLEFPHVYIVGLEDGLLPHSRAKIEGTLDEERRLFSVAITRAMQCLTLSHCAGRKKYGQLMPCHPSPFLKELPAELVEHADEKIRQPVPVDTGRNLFEAMRVAVK
jgi:superfamily I DNA/RNA helicase